MNKPRVLVCGGRDFNNKQLLHDELDFICEARGWTTVPTDDNNYCYDVVLIHGAARGADRLADGWAVANWCEIEEYKADWSKYGKSAGYKRNQQMLDEGKPDLVVAFPGGRGTAMMVKIAKQAGVEVIEVSE